MLLLHKEEFEPHIGKVFTFAGAEPPLILHHIESLGPPAEGFTRPPFILIFRGPRPGPVLPTAIHEVTVDTGEIYTLHVSAIPTEPGPWQEYQSSFN